MLTAKVNALKAQSKDIPSARVESSAALPAGSYPAAPPTTLPDLGEVFAQKSKAPRVASAAPGYRNSAEAGSVRNAAGVVGLVLSLAASF